MNNPFANTHRGAICCLAALALAACGSGGSSMGGSTASTSAPQSCSSGSCGSALLSVTDAAGAFQMYQVAITALQLTRADGTVAQMLPAKTPVDFTQLVDLSELFTSGLIPSGSYVSASMTLDYSAAQIVLAGSASALPLADIYLNGSTTSVAGGNATLTVTVTLDPAHPLVVTPGTVSNLALDFNLDASNIVSGSGGATTLSVNPLLTASLVPDQTRQLRARGVLVSVGTAAADGSGSFVLAVRPCDDNAGNGGQFTVDTAATTTFAVNGANSAGAAGLAALAAAQTAAGSAPFLVVAYGSLDTSTLVFTATSVAAGTNVIGSGSDGLEGTVVAVGAGPTANTHVLTVTNGRMDPMDQDAAQFVPRVSVTVGTGTSVAELGQAGTFDYTTISVGQRLQISGTFGKDTSGNPVLDATAGTANLLPTQLDGTVSSLSGNTVTVSLQSIDGLSTTSTPGIFDFAGTGATSASDAVATAYTVGLPTGLSTSGVTATTPLGFIGFVTPFGKAAGSAPPDFVATTLVSYAGTTAQLTLAWAPPGDASLGDFTLSSSGLAIDATALAASSGWGLRSGFQTISLTGLAGGLQVVPDPAPTGPVGYTVVDAFTWQIQNFADWGGFNTALAAALAGSGGGGGSSSGGSSGSAAPTVLEISAKGPFVPSSGTLQADRLIVVVGPGRFGD